VGSSFLVNPIKKCISFINVSESEISIGLNLNSPEFDFFQRQTEEKVLSKKSLKKNHYQKMSEQIPYPRISKETFPAKRLERGISTQKMSEGILSETSLTTCIYPRTI